MSTLDHKIEVYEQALQDIIGNQIQRIHYYEILYDRPLYDADDHHSLDYGLQFTLTNGQQIYFIWDSTYLSHHLKFEVGSIEQEFNTGSSIGVYEVSQHEEWLPFLHVPITAARSHWSYLTTFKGWFKKGERTYFPETIELTFEHQKSIFIAAIEIREKGDIMGAMDHVSVFFDREVIEYYNIIGKI